MKIFAKIKMIYAFIVTLIYLFMVLVSVAIFRKHDNQIKKFFSKLGLFLLGMKVKVEGIADENAQMLIVNHQSAMDINIIETAYPYPLSWIAKKELFDIPVYGRIMDLTKSISVERENKAGLVKLLKDAKIPLEEDRKLVIFPEGTRSKSRQMLKFKSGAKMVADKHKLKVQPVVILNSGNLFNISDFTQKSGQIKVVFLESFEAQRDQDWLNTTREKMIEVYNNELANNPSYR